MSVENILARLLCLCLCLRVCVCVINEAWQPTTCKCISAAATSPFPAWLGSLHFLRFYGLRVSYSFALCSNYKQTALKRILFKQVPEYMQLCRLPLSPSHFHTDWSPTSVGSTPFVCGLLLLCWFCLFISAKLMASTADTCVTHTHTHRENTTLWLQDWQVAAFNEVVVSWRSSQLNSAPPAGCPQRCVCPTVTATPGKLLHPNPPLIHPLPPPLHTLLGYPCC